MGRMSRRGRSCGMGSRGPAGRFGLPIRATYHADATRRRRTTTSTERVRLTVAAARALGEAAMRGIGYEPEEARILADHVIDAALCGYEYSGLPKLLNVADHPFFKRSEERRVGKGWMYWWSTSAS